MATPVIMPQMGQSVESCVITKFYKKKGDQVAVGDKLFAYETDKSSFEEEATVAGEMLDIFWEEDDDVECKLVVCVIGEKGESTAEFNPKKAAAAEAPKAEAVAVKEEVKVEAKAVVAETPAEGKVKISPRAKALADKQGLDYKYAVPTGPNGRIIERDVRAMSADGVRVTAAAAGEYAQNGAVEGTGLGGRITVGDYAVKEEAPAAAAAPAVEAPFVEEKLSNIRKVIAKSMHASLSEMAQLTLNTSFDATQILAYRARVKASMADLGMENISLNDIVMYAVAKTLTNPDFRSLNAHFFDDKMVFFNNVNLGIAVDTPRGLLVPTVFGAEKLTLNEFTKQARSLIEAAKNGSASPDVLKGASFTVTNLGNMGIESFTPVVNPPQTGILGVCATETKIRVVNGEIKPYQAMGLSLTFDHRALDGAPAAKFLQALKKNLENFDLMLAK